MSGLQKQEMRLAFEAQPIVATLRGRLPTALELQQISIERGPELAGAVFHRAVLASPLHAGFCRAVTAAASAAPPADRNGLECVIVPFSSPRLGPKQIVFVNEARASARTAGYQTDFVECDAGASVAGVARALADHLAAKAPDAKLVLLTNGPGSCAVRYLAQKRGPNHADLLKIRGWLNVGGAFGGVAANDLALDSVVGRWAAQASCFLRGRSYEGFLESSARFGLWRERFTPPSRAIVASLVPTPMPWHLPRALRGTYARLASRGPSDGAVLLTDSAARPGLIYPAWGMSHASSGTEWSWLMERALSVIARSIAAAEADRERDLSVEYAETDPELKLARREREGEDERQRRLERGSRARLERTDPGDDEEEFRFV